MIINASGVHMVFNENDMYSSGINIVFNENNTYTSIYSIYYTFKSVHEESPNGLHGRMGPGIGGGCGV